MQKELYIQFSDETGELTLKKSYAMLTFLALMLALSGCGQDKSKESANSAGKAALESAPEQVQQLYAKNCLGCHGNMLQGKMGPETNLQNIGTRKTKDEITDKIMNGGKGMIAFKSSLKDTEIQALSGWLAGVK